MKRASKLGLMFVLASTLYLSACAGEYYVSDQPAEPVYERPVAPYEGAIWIDGDWAWSGGQYVYTHGHWDHPRQGHVYMHGSWEHSGHGYRWHRGHWN